MKKQNMASVLLGVCAACVLILSGCAENDASARQKLDAILKSDLASIIADMPKTSLADSVYYSLVSYQTFKKGEFTRKAVADFYFLKGVKVKITRKYRFVPEANLWERYYNVYTFIEDSARAAPTADSLPVSVPAKKNVW